MAQITYARLTTPRGGMAVFIDGKRAGTIKGCDANGYRYHVKGAPRAYGERFPTIVDVQRSLEGDD